MSNQSRNFTDEQCLVVGRAVLKAYNQWTENPRGTHIVIPIKIPGARSDQPDWAMSIKCDMPWFIEYYFENGEFKTKHVNLKDFLTKV